MQQQQHQKPFLSAKDTRKISLRQHLATRVAPCTAVAALEPCWFSVGNYNILEKKVGRETGREGGREEEKRNLLLF